VPRFKARIGVDDRKRQAREENGGSKKHEAHGKLHHDECAGCMRAHGGRTFAALQRSNQIESK
jgi:hypothetical protein